MHTTRFAAAALLAATAASPVLAGGLTETIMAPIAAPMAPAVPLSFAGAYAGASLGAGNLDVGNRFDFLEEDDDDLLEFGSTDTDLHYGVHVGYNVQRGNLVFGPEFAVFGASSELDGDFDDDVTDDVADEGNIGVDLNYGARLALRGGYAMGPNLVYGLVGAAYADADSRSPGLEDGADDVGYAVGFGYERLVTDRVAVGAQYTLHAFDDFGDSDEDLDYRTLEARVSIKF